MDRPRLCASDSVPAGWDGEAPLNFFKRSSVLVALLPLRWLSLRVLGGAQAGGIFDTGTPGRSRISSSRCHVYCEVKEKKEKSRRYSKRNQ